MQRQLEPIYNTITRTFCWFSGKNIEGDDVEDFSVSNAGDTALAYSFEAGQRLTTVICHSTDAKRWFFRRVTLHHSLSKSIIQARVIPKSFATNATANSEYFRDEPNADIICDQFIEDSPWVSFMTARKRSGH